MEKPFVSIIIPVFNSRKTLGNTIEACKSQDYPKDKIEVIVVDDGSTEDIKSLVEDLGVKYIYQENSGPASARNNGWMSSKGEALFFTDADCLPLKDCISVMVRSLYDKNASVVAGTYEIQNEKDVFARCIHSEIIFRHSRMPKYINSFGAYNILIKRSVMEELGGFNEYYLTSSAEDSELAYRVIKKGYKIYFDKNAVVAHFHEKSLSKYLKKQAIRSFWAIKLWKHHSGFALNDYYLHWKDLLEIPVAVMIIISLPLLFLNPVKIGFILFLTIYTTLQIIIPLKIYSKRLLKKDFFPMVFMMFVRGFARVFGGALSFVYSPATKAPAGKPATKAPAGKPAEDLVAGYSIDYYKKYKNFNHSRLSRMILEDISPDFAIAKSARRADRLNPTGFNLARRGNPKQISNAKFGIKSFIDLNGNSKASLIIDIGCGIGKLASVFKDYAESVIGLDISLDAIKLVDKTDKRIFFIRGDALHIPMKDGVCNICTCIHVIEHVKDFNKLLSEINRIMAHKGRVIFITPNKKWTRFGLPFLKDKTHIKEFNIDELKEIVSAYFSIEKIKPVSMFTSFGFFNPILNIVFKPDIYISGVKI